MSKPRHIVAMTTDDWDRVTDRANELMREKRSQYGLEVATEDGRITMAAVGAAIQAYHDIISMHEAQP